MRVLTVNAGSSSLKLRLLDDDELIRSADLAPEGDVGAAVRDWPAPEAVGHRIVHGGTDFSAAVRIDTAVEQRLRDLTDLAPLHQPKSLAALDTVSAALPDVPAVACFDTAFHAGLPAEAATYAIPAEWRNVHRIRRYGFHGLSHAYAARRAVELTGEPAHGLRIVSCHLGAGASLCAVKDGRSVDTTMGFTPLEGLVMATRSGTVDPGLVLWLVEHQQLPAAEIAMALEHRSGLLGLSGTADMRELEQRCESRDLDARLALDVHGHRLAAEIAAMAAAVRGLDVLVFTGGVGEHSARVRADAADRLGWLGVDIDSDRNLQAAPDAEVTGAGARVRTLVITAREDLQIAGEVKDLIGTAG